MKVEHIKYDTSPSLSALTTFQRNKSLEIQLCACKKKKKTTWRTLPGKAKTACRQWQMQQFCRCNNIQRTVDINQVQQRKTNRIDDQILWRVNHSVLFIEAWRPDTYPPTFISSSNVEEFWMNMHLFLFLSKMQKGTRWWPTIYIFMLDEIRTCPFSSAKFATLLGKV